MRFEVTAEIESEVSDVLAEMDLLKNQSVGNFNFTENIFKLPVFEDTQKDRHGEFVKVNYVLNFQWARKNTKTPSMYIKLWVEKVVKHVGFTESFVTTVDEDIRELSEGVFEFDEYDSEWLEQEINFGNNFDHAFYRVEWDSGVGGRLSGLTVDMGEPTTDYQRIIDVVIDLLFHNNDDASIILATEENLDWLDVSKDECVMNSDGDKALIHRGTLNIKYIKN